MKKSVSFNSLPDMCKCGKWDLNIDDYDAEHCGIKVIDVPNCRSAKKYNTLGLGEARFDGIEYQGYGVPHYVDYAEGFGTSEGTVCYTGFENGKMSDLIDTVTCGSEIYLHWEWLGCKCKQIALL